MNVEQLFQNLSYGELSNLSMGLDGAGGIEERHQPKIIHYANEALLRLYSRFVLKERDLIIEMQEGVTNYHLIPRFSLQKHDPLEEAKPYIIDLPLEPFEDDVIKVLSVYNSFGTKIPLNDPNRANSVFTPQAKVLQVPHPIPGQALTLGYQCRHKPLDHEDLSQEIELPAILHSALLAYIASRVYSNMNTPDASVKGQEHMLNYERICAEAFEHDTVNTSVVCTNERFELNGWV